MHAVQQWAGHADIATTQRFYLRVNDDLYLKAATSDLFANSTEKKTESSDIEAAEKTQ
jgi:hypothetical protein